MSKSFNVKILLIVLVATFILVGTTPTYADDNGDDPIPLVPNDAGKGDSESTNGFGGNPANCTVKAFEPVFGGPYYIESSGEVECDYWVTTIILEVCLQKAGLFGIWTNQGCKTETLFSDDFLGVVKDVDCNWAEWNFKDYRTKAYGQALINGTWYYGTHYSPVLDNHHCDT